MTPFNPLWSRAIASIESDGNGGYSALGPLTKSGDRAYGKYQVMGNNIGPWSQEALGRTLTPQQFLNDPDAQEEVFKQRFGGYVNKYGSPREAASVWFTGRPLAQGGDAQDILGTTGLSYANKFDKAMGGGVSAIEAAMRNGSNNGTMNILPPIAQAQAQAGLAGQPEEQQSYDWAQALQGAGAALQSIDNPRGAAALAQLASMGAKSNKKSYQGQYDPKSGTYFRLGSDGSVSMMKNPNASDEPAKPKLTESALKNVGESVEKYGTIASLNQEASDVLDDIQNGKLNLGAVRNALNAGKNFTGNSDDESRAFARWEQFKRKLANDQLLLAKGVQTEGDAYRAMQEFVAGSAGYDNESAKEALKRIISRGQEAVTQRGRASLDAHTSAYGNSDAFKPYMDQADRWSQTYDTINKRIEGYSKPKQTVQPSTQFKIINVR